MYRLVCVSARLCIFSFVSCTKNDTVGTRGYLSLALSLMINTVKKIKRARNHVRIVNWGNGTDSVDDVLSLGGIRFLKVGVKWGV